MARQTPVPERRRAGSAPARRSRPPVPRTRVRRPVAARPVRRPPAVQANRYRVTFYGKTGTVIHPQSKQLNTRTVGQVRVTITNARTGKQSTGILTATEYNTFQRRAGELRRQMDNGKKADFKAVGKKLATAHRKVGKDLVQDMAVQLLRLLAM